MYVIYFIEYNICKLLSILSGSWIFYDDLVILFKVIIMYIVFFYLLKDKVLKYMLDVFFKYDDLIFIMILKYFDESK